MSTIVDEFRTLLNLEKRGFAQCADYPNYGDVYSLRLNDATVYVDFLIENDKLIQMTSSICFNMVEDVIYDLCNKYQLEYKYPFTINPHYLRNKDEYVIALLTKARSKKVTQKNVHEITSLVNEYLTLMYQPFWEKYSVLQTVNDEIIDKVDQMKLSDYISFQMPLKKMIIMKMCNNPKYGEYVDWLEGMRKDAFLKDPESKKAPLDAFLELKDQLN